MCMRDPRVRFQLLCAVGLALAIALAVVAVGLAPTLGSSGSRSGGGGWTPPWLRS
jgi:hypothetical protein